MDVPAYNGSLFSSDPNRFPDGALIKDLRLDDAVIGHTLRSILIDEVSGGYGPVDFRSLSVREFGTIYEGLLESSLSRADHNLVIDNNQAFVIAEPGQEVEIYAGGIYFHNASGLRKSTGSYFTPDFVVDHLVQKALTPILDRHLLSIARRLDKGDEAGAYKEFFDFRVADIAMGSGHFLIAAIDHIGLAMSTFLTNHHIPGVSAELNRLENVAREALGEVADYYKLEPSGLLRRQIARHCIYGVDTNDIAVELSKMAIWLHTFVPGLPIFTLDYNLVCANSITGIDNIEEAINILEPEPTLLRLLIQKSLKRATDSLKGAANLLEADASEVLATLEAHRLAIQYTEEAKIFFDAAVAARFGELEEFQDVEDLDEIVQLANHTKVRQLMHALKPGHMPCLFPRVFSRNNPGFNVLIGNPPWEHIRHEPKQFWVRRDPGFNNLSPDKQKSRIKELRATRSMDAKLEKEEIKNREKLKRVVKTSYQWQGHGPYDFAKLFAERNRKLLCEGGGLGLVLPLGITLLAGWKHIRDEFYNDGNTDIVQCRNTGGWLFPGIHKETTVVLFTYIDDSQDNFPVNLVPGVISKEIFDKRRLCPLRYRISDLARAVEGDLILPWYDSYEEPKIFNHLINYPHLGSGSGWVQADNDSRWDFSSSGRHNYLVDEYPKSSDYWRVLQARHIVPYQIIDDLSSGKFINDLVTLESLDLGVDTIDGNLELNTSHPAIVFRHATGRTASRTLVATILPRSGVVHATGYAHGLKHKSNISEVDLLALLGLINSPICDWWSRRVVNRHITAPVVHSIPLPDWEVEDRRYVATRVADIFQYNNEINLTRVNNLLDLATGRNRSVTQLLGEIDARVAKGFGLNKEFIRIILASFTRKGISNQYRKDIMEAMQ